MHTYSFILIATLFTFVSIVCGDFTASSPSSSLVVVSGRFYSGQFSANDGSLYITTSNIFSAQNALWYNDRVQATSDWSTSFDVKISSAGSAGEGFAFVIQDQSLSASSSITALGSTLSNYVAVVFDLVSNQISIQANGVNAASPVSFPSSPANVGQVTFSISYSGGTLQVSQGSASYAASPSAIASATLDIGSYVSSSAYVGLIGSTSETETADIQIYSWQFTGSEDFSFTDNSDLSDFSLVDGSVFVGNDIYLTRSGNLYETVAVYYPTDQQVNAGFSSSFSFQILPPSAGVPANGFVFLVSNDGYNVGGAGFLLGIDTLSSYVGVKFQTNTAGSALSNNSITLVANSDVIGGNFAPNIYLADGNTHICVINYDGSTMAVYVDGGLIFNVAVDIADQVGEDTAKIGFTATTDTNSETCIISDWTFSEGAPVTSISSLTVGYATLSTGRFNSAATSGGTSGSGSSTSGGVPQGFCAQGCDGQNIVVSSPSIGASLSLVNSSVSVIGSLNFSSTSLRIETSQISASGRINVDSSNFHVDYVLSSAPSPQMPLIPIFLSQDVVHLDGGLQLNIRTDIAQLADSQTVIPIAYGKEVSGDFHTLVVADASQPNSQPVVAQNYQAVPVKQQKSYGVLVKVNNNNGSNFPKWLIIVLCVVPVVVVVVVILVVLKLKNKLGTARAVHRASKNLQDIEMSNATGASSGQGAAAM